MSSRRLVGVPVGIEVLREHSDVVTKLLAALERSKTNLAPFADVAPHELVQPLTTQRRRDDVTLCR